MALEDARPQGAISFFLGFWRDETVVIHSPMRPAEALAALSERVDPQLALFGRRPARGYVGSRGGWLQATFNRGSSARSIVRFDVTGDGAGSRLTCWLGGTWVSRVFMVVWGAGVATIGSGAIVSAPPEGRYGAVLMLGFMLLFGLLMIALGRWLGRQDGPFLIQMMVEAVDGRIVR